MHHRPSLFCLLTTLALTTVGVAQADTQLTYTDTGLGGPQERKTLIQIHGDKVRMEEVGSGIYSLYDDSQKKLYTINTQTQQYIETTPDKVRERISKMDAMQEQMKAAMQEQMAQMPEEQRNMLQQRMQEAEQQAEAMKNAPVPKIDITRTDRKETIQGMACNISSINSDGRALRDICIAPADAIGAEDHKMLLAMFEYMDDIARESARAQGMAAPAAGSASLHQNGLALRIQALPDGPRSELTDLKKAPLSDADFSIPAGFREFEPADAPAAPPPAAGNAPATAASVNN